jgi:hypothetical protein
MEDFPPAKIRRRIPGNVWARRKTGELLPMADHALAYASEVHHSWFLALWILQLLFHAIPDLSH